jgi:hypothetical protein
MGGAPETLAAWVAGGFRVETRGSAGRYTNRRNRRVSLVAPRPGEGLLTEGTLAVRPPPRQHLFMPPYPTFSGSLVTYGT